MTAQYLKEGWRPHGPGKCRCPLCGGVTSTNALARAKHKCRETDIKDVNGKSLRVGDTVRAVEFGPRAIHRLVKAIGEGELLAGYIMVTGSIAWESSRHFEKVS